MELWMSSEQMHECFENMQIQREIKPKINELIKNCTLGDYVEWAVITIILNENGPDYKEIIRRSLKNKELESINLPSFLPEGVYITRVKHLNENFCFKLIL